MDIVVLNVEYKKQENVNQNKNVCKLNCKPISWAIFYEDI